MSIREADPAAEALLTGRDAAISRYSTVRRFLPHQSRRLIGAWCFADHFGPQDSAGGGMLVPPHPHIGLQTVSWLMAGDVLHRDSLGSEQVIRPGQLNLMTSGHGIAHSEQSTPGTGDVLHGLQLWIALPAAARNQPPRFEHHADMPQFDTAGARLTVVVGELAGHRSPATVHSPLVGAAVELTGSGQAHLPLEPAHEYGLLVTSGEVAVDGLAVPAGSLRYLAPGRERLALAWRSGATGFVMGGAPFEEPIVMWWNFVGADHEAIVAAREDWAAGRRFGSVPGFAGDPMPAPALPSVKLLARHRDGTRGGGISK